MKVLVACEFSGVVRRAFRALGHNAWSCDLLPAEDNSEFHIQGDVLTLKTGGFACLRWNWDLMIAHPPCTDLAVSGARYFAQKRADGRQQKALAFVQSLLDAPIDRIALENPVSVISSYIRKPDQIIQPWQFGHPESKATCLWLKNLQPLVPTKVLQPEWAKNPDGSDYRDAKGKRYSPTHYFSGRMQRDNGQLMLIEDARSRQRARWANQTTSGQNKLPPSPDGWKLRSRTYTGIAQAMAQQWGALVPATIPC